MSTEELLVRLLDQALPMLPYMLIVTGATVVALCVLMLLSRGLWVDQRRFRWLGLLFSLNGAGCLRLACSWIKLILLWAYVFGFQKLEPVHYLLFLVCVVLEVFPGRRISRIPVRLLWNALETGALLSCGVICGFIQDAREGGIYLVIYWLMAVFTALFGGYIFLTEMNDISAGRELILEREREAGREEGHEGR